jgi:hypothetical protein
MTAGGLSFAEIDRLCSGQHGEFDVACPWCGPDRRTAYNRKREVLHIWRETPDFASYNCARCRAKGWARDGDGDHPGAPAARPRESAADAKRRDEAEAAKIARRIGEALCLFDEAGELAGSPGWHYLARRGVDLDALPSRNGESLRWHQRCPWRRDGGTRPAIVALFTDAVTGEPRAIHRIAPIGGSNKADKLMLGPTKGCVIRLWPDDEVTTGLVLGEGIETVLAAATRIAHRGTSLSPAWAAGDAGHLAALPILAGIEVLTLLVDHDESRTGQDAAQACSARWTAAGREVIRLVPRLVRTDFADLVRGRPA